MSVLLHAALLAMPGSGCGQADSLRGGDVIPPPANWGLLEEEEDSLGCFWEKSPLMWRGWLLQAGFVTLLPLCFSLLCVYLQEGAPRVLQLPCRTCWCGKWGNLLSLDLCPVSVSSIGLEWKTTSPLYSASFSSESSCPGTGRWMGLWGQVAVAVVGREGGGLPRDVPVLLQQPWEHHKVSDGPVCLCLLAGGVVQTSRRSV